jgi:hypothetical protein
MSVWLTQAGLAGTSESDIVSGFCDHCVAGWESGLLALRCSLTRYIPSTRGRVLRWAYDPLTLESIFPHIRCAK